MVDQVGAGFEQSWIRFGACDDQVDAVVEAVEFEVGTHGAVRVVAHDGDGAAGLAATRDNVLDVGGWPGGRDGG